MQPSRNSHVMCVRGTPCAGRRRLKDAAISLRLRPAAAGVTSLSKLSHPASRPARGGQRGVRMHSPSPLILSCPPSILASLSQNPSHAHAAVAKCRTDALLLVWKKIVLPTPHSQGQTPGPRRRAKFHHAICSASAHALPPWARARQYFSHVAATGRRHVLPMEEEDGAVHGMAAA